MSETREGERDERKIPVAPMYGTSGLSNVSQLTDSSSKEFASPSNDTSATEYVKVHLAPEPPPQADKAG